MNFLGGERSLILMTHGRAPVPHLWPLDKVLSPVDISDPHTFLSIKRGILQYAWIKPFLAIGTIACKATGTWREGIIAWDSGYLWTGFIYNVSIGWSLYDLALFWVCMSEDLQAFRPMPKFLCIKGIIFASWWQGFFLSVLVWLGAVTSASEDYTAKSLAAAIQDALICFEMPFFAISHWYAFSWKDYSDRTISDARMAMRFALRDAFGPRDLIEDAKQTWGGEQYDYRNFDAEDNVMAHEESSSRRARMREGMRYEKNGRGKYWIPAPGDNDSKQPLLSRLADSHARTMSPGDGSNSRSTSRQKGYGTNRELEEPELDPEEERLYDNARALEFGDWNYPVINTHYATLEDRLRTDPNLVTTSTNRAILQPTAANKKRRANRIKSMQDEAKQNQVYRSASSSSDQNGSSGSASGSGSGGDHQYSTLAKGKEKLESLPVVGKLIRQGSSESTTSYDSQLVDLVVEDHEASRIERVRARKEGGAGWNSTGPPKHFVNMYNEISNDGKTVASESVSHGFNPDRRDAGFAEESAHTLDAPLDIDKEAVEEDGARGADQLEHDQPWEEARYNVGQSVGNKYDELDNEQFNDERDAWGAGR